MDAFSQKVAVVTGAGSGIGRALAIELARRGAQVAVSDINAEALEGTVEAIASDKTLARKIDVGDIEQMSQFAEDTAAHFGVVHQIYNNAGIASPVAGILETEYETFEHVLNVNLWGVIYGTREFLPHIIKSGDGRVINICSLNGLLGQPGLGPYVTSKFAVRGFSETLRSEMMLAHAPVQVAAVYPAGVRTAIFDGAMAHQEEERKEVYDKVYGNDINNVPPESCARIILNAVARGKSRILTGRTVRDDWLPRIFPEKYLEIMVAWTRHTFRQ